jgi:hypothetical protein
VTRGCPTSLSIKQTHMSCVKEYRILLLALLGPTPMSALSPNASHNGLSHWAKLLSTRPLQDHRRGVILPDGQITDLAVQPLLQKESRFRLTQINSRIRIVPSRERGVSRSSRTLGTGCSGRGSTRRATARGRMMLNRVRRSRVVLPPRRWRQVGGAIR